MTAQRKDDPSTDITVEAEPGNEGLIELLLEEGESAGEKVSPRRIEGILIAKLAGFDAEGVPHIEVRELVHRGHGLATRSLVLLGEEHIGREVAVMCEAGDPARPLVVGLLHQPRVGVAKARVDGERLEFSANQEIVLRCGDASITLTHEGKVLIKGAYVLTHSKGVNRIQGGSVKIN